MFEYVTIGDNHIGNARNTIPEMLNALDNWLIDHEDIIFSSNGFFFEGDFWDMLLTCSNPGTYLTLKWMNKFLKRCRDNNIIVRILEGTESHDRNQSKLFDALANNIKGLDFKYVDELSHEKLEEYDIDILYIPDEWRLDEKDTLNEAKELLSSLPIDSFDLAIMHGAFEYQYPEHLNLPTHCQEEYEKIVTYFINIGHVHLWDPRGKVIPAGSFDRISFNEEEDKGGVYCVINGDDSYFRQLVNNHAKKFIDLVLPEDVNKADLFIYNGVKDLPPNSYVRLVAKVTHPFFKEYASLKSKYPELIFEKKNIKKVKKKEEMVTATYASIALHKRTLPSVLKEYLKRKSYTDQEVNDMLIEFNKHLGR